MPPKLIVGFVLFLVGILLQEISYMVDIWILRVIGGVLWSVGLVMGTNALLASKRKK